MGYIGEEEELIRRVCEDPEETPAVPDPVIIPAEPALVPA